MKRNKIALQLAIALLAATFGSCKKDVLETNETTVTGTYSSLYDFYEKHAADTESFYINPTQDTILITGDSGTFIGFHGNSLVDSSGGLPQGMVKVTLKEIYGVKSMLLSHTPATSNGNILQSGGMLYLKFEANNILYKPNAPMGALMPASNGIPGMKIYYGQPDADNGINWAMDPASIVADTLNTYAFSFDSLGYGWMNVARLYSISNPASISITPAVNAERGETIDMAVYLVLPSINSVVNVTNTSATQNISVNNLPSGMPAVAAIIGVGRITQKAYFGKTNFTVTSSQNINVSVSQMSDQQIENSLSSL